MLRIVTVLLSMALFANSAAAQIPTKGNIFFGYSYGRTNFSAPVAPPDTGSIIFSNPANLNGWNGALEGKVLPFVGMVADLSGYYGAPGFAATCGLIVGCLPRTGHANATVYNVLLGPRLSVSVGKVRPFAHALVGVSHGNQSAHSIFSNSATSFADALGGGIDYHLVPLVAWRVQLDFLESRFFSTTQDNFRFSTGLVLRF